MAAADLDTGARLDRYTPGVAALLPWARSVVLVHAPAGEDDRGLSCDERGCLVCNVGGEDAAELLAAGVVAGHYPEPDDDELDELIEEAAATGVNPARPIPELVYAARHARGQGHRRVTHALAPEDPARGGRRAACGAAPASGLVHALGLLGPAPSCPRCAAIVAR
jgi:hypothetical protein